MRFRIELKSFRSKVARHIFLLFMICAVAPVSAFALFSYIQVKNQLQEQSRLRLQREAKSVAVSVYERMVLSRRDLSSLAARVACQPETAPPEAAIVNSADLAGERFSAIGLLAGGRVTALRGEPVALSPLTEAETAHLKRSQTLLRVDPSPNKGTRLWLLAAIDPTGSDGRIVWARLNPDYLWEVADRLPRSTELCILGKQTAPLFCSFEPLAQLPAHLMRQVSRSHTGRFQWQHGNKSHLASYTTIFLKSNFLYPEWIVLVSEPEEQVLAPMENFTMSFPVLIILSLGLVFFLSMSLIRKNLTPIEQLEAATRRIANGEFGHRVEIRTRDEFQQLGQAFNDMSAQLEAGQQLLIRTAKMATMGQMAAGIIHEIKQPLSGIHGHIQVAMLDAPNDAMRERIAYIMEGVEKLDAILNRFRSFAFTSPREMQHIDLHTVIDSVTRLMEHQMLKQRIRVNVDHQPQTPSILGDHQALQQVVSNLLINAMHALEEKPPEDRQVHIRLYREHRDVLLEVEDNGIGIPGEVQEKIFDPFFSTKDPEKGTGLGMAIVESILHQHGATIGVTSKEHVGTTFKIRFPERESTEKETE